MSSDLLDCHSQSCYFALERSGQRVNGPCRCLSNLPPPVRSQIRMTLLAKMNHEREKFARIAESAAIDGHAVQAPSCKWIAQKIREA